MSTRAAEELYYDSETTLRLVDTALDELRVMEDELRGDDRGRLLVQQMLQAPAGASELPELVLRAYGEIQSGLESLRRSRDVLERTTMEKIHHMGDRIREVNSATEVAATDILDGVDRALALVARLDTTEDGPERVRVRGELRDELFEVMGCLQFQDITSQQLTYASSVLYEMESRLANLAQIFDPASFGLAPLPRLTTPCTPRSSYDPATAADVNGCGQEVVDEIFGG
jgi:hypothetical protein